MINRQNVHSKNVQWKNLTNEQLAHAIELLIRREWLQERQTMIAILKSQEFNAEDALKQVNANVYFSEGPYLTWRY